MERLGLSLDDHPRAATPPLPQTKDKRGAKKVRIKDVKAALRSQGKAAAFASPREDSLKGRLVAVVFARRSLEVSVNLAKCGAKFRRRKTGWNPRHGEIKRINHRRR
jgi:hypothetical protein